MHMAYTSHFSGIGSGMALGPTIILLNKYFDKRSGVANGIALSGSSLGSLSFPILSRYLIDTYGFGGTFIILTGLFLQNMVVGALLRPVDFYTKRKRRPVASTKSRTNGLIETSTELVTIQQPKRFRNTGEMRVNKKFSSNDNIMYTSIHDLGPQGTKHLAKRYCFRKKDCSTGQGECLGGVLECGIMKNTLFQLYLCIVVASGIAASLPATFVAGQANDSGASENEIAYLMSTIGIADFMGRILLGFLGDRLPIKRHYLVAFNMVVMGVIFQIQPIYKSYWSLCVVAAVIGFFGTASMSLYPLLLIQFCGKDNLSNGMGIMLMMMGIVYFITFPTLGTYSSIDILYASK